MKFSDIPGNEEVKKALLAMSDSGRIPHALLLYENDGCGALALQYLNNDNSQVSRLTFPDMRFTFPISSGTKVSGEVKNLTCDDYSALWKEQVLKNPYFLENELTSALGIDKKNGLITVAEGRAIMQKLSLAPVTDGWRGIFIYLPEKMNQQTANMLLKSLEEPEPKTIFILITHSPESVLPTISSRCQGIRVLPLSKEEIITGLESRLSVPHEEAVSLASSCGGSLGVAIRKFTDEGESSLFDELFKSLLEKITSRDLSSALEVGEALAALDSREKQKAFCIFAGESVRALMMIGRGREDIAGVGEDASWYRGQAALLPDNFAVAAGTVLGRTASMLERNVSAKMLFCNLVTRLFMVAGTR